MKSLALLVVGVIFGIFVLSGARPAQPDHSTNSTQPPNPTQVPTPTPQPIKVTAEKIEAVNQQIYAEQGIRGRYLLKDADFRFIGKTLAIDAYATCKAGIDYDAQPARIEQNGTSVKITVPPPEVFPCGTTDVTYSGDGGLPFLGPKFTEEQHNQLYRFASQKIQEEAEHGELAAKARASALREIELNARKLGMDQITVVFAKDGVGNGL